MWENASTMSVTPTERVRAAGLRATRPRLAVLQALTAHPHAPTATILAAVRAELPAVSTQAVYDCLAALTDAGVVRRIQPAGSVARYELRVGDNHHHLVCRVCGTVVDVDCARGARPCLEADPDHGYLIDEAEVIYWGTCPACTAATSPTNPTDATSATSPTVGTPPTDATGPTGATDPADDTPVTDPADSAERQASTGNS